MPRRVFIKCLNGQKKAFNLNFGSIIGSIIFVILFGIGKGLMWGAGAGAVGFMVGGWISDKWYIGVIQSYIYKKIPYANLWLSSNVPQSSNKYEL